MGTINYGTSQFITIAAPDYNGDAEAYNALEDWVREKLNQYNFEYYDLDIEYGYYEGFYINIQKNDSWDKSMAVSTGNPSRKRRLL